MVILRTLVREMAVAAKYPLTLATFLLWAAWLAYALYRQAFLDQVLAGALGALWLVSLPAGLTLFLLLYRDARFKAGDLTSVATLSPGAHYFVRVVAGFLVYYGLFAVFPTLVFFRAMSDQPAVTGPYGLLLAAPSLALTVSAAALFAAVGLGLLSVPALIVVFLAPLSLFVVGAVAPWATLFSPLGKIQAGTLSTGFRDPGAAFQALGAAALLFAFTGVGLVSAALVSRRKAFWLAAAALCLAFAGWQGFTAVQSFGRVSNPRFFMGFGFDFSALNRGKAKVCELRDQTLTIEPSGQDRAAISASLRIVMNDAKKCSLTLPEAAEGPSASMNDKPVEMKKKEGQSRGPFRAQDQYTLDYAGQDARMTLAYVLPAFQLTAYSAYGMGPLYSMGFGGRLLRISLQSIAPGAGSGVPQIASPTHLEVRGVNPRSFAADGTCTLNGETLVCDLTGTNPSVFEFTPQQIIADSERVRFSVKVEHAAPFLARQPLWKKAVASLDQCLGRMGVANRTKLIEADWVTFRMLKGTGFVGAEALMEWVRADDAALQLGFGSSVINAVFGTRTFGGSAPPALTDEIALITAYICGRENAGFSDDVLRESLRKMDSNWGVQINLRSNQMFKDRRKNFYDLLSAYKQKPDEFRRRLAAVIADILANGERSLYSFNAPGMAGDNYVDYLEFNAGEISHEARNRPEIPGGGRVRVEIR